MKSEKEKLQAKSVEQLKASYKRMGGKLVNTDGKAKTKVQLINGIVMKNRLAGKSMGGNAKPTTVKTKTNNAAALKSIEAREKRLDAVLAEFAKRLDKMYSKR